MSGASLTALCGAQIFTGHTVVRRSAVLLRDGAIVDIVAAADVPGGARRIDLGNRNLAPGFIDLQINGGGDVLFGGEPTVETLARIGAAHARFGTTRFLPTVISGPRETMSAARVAAAAALSDGKSGVLGIHFEGPFLNPAKKGVHAAAPMRVPDEADRECLAAPGIGAVLVTLAPEIVPSGFIAELVQSGVRIAAGHTDATVEVLRRARAEGLTLYTHLFNAMGQLTARAPGVVGAALADADAWCSIIADGHHLHQASLTVAWRAKPAGKLLLVSDAMPPVGGTQRSFTLDGRTIHVADGRCVTADGVLAGSAIGLSDAVRYCARTIGIPLEEALRMASTYVADYLGRSDLGRIAPGACADLVLFDDDVNVIATLRNGVLIHGALPP